MLFSNTLYTLYSPGGNPVYPGQTLYTQGKCCIPGCIWTVQHQLPPELFHMFLFCFSESVLYCNNTFKNKYITRLYGHFHLCLFFSN